MSEDEEKNEEFELRPFIRNKYYYGKLMTVTDFELEQEYFNRKRYLLNRLIYGKGLLCGFRHFKLMTENSNGEVSIIFKDGGVALDSLGHEIVVPKNVERKILDESNKSFNKNDFSDITYLYLNYSSRYSSLASEHATLTFNSSPNDCPRIVEDFEVIASVNYPEEGKNEMRSCTADTKSDMKVFFVAVKKDSNGELTIYDESYLWWHYGKLMTVTDFELEQEYFNRKRYLLNRLIYGKGLLCGFRHFKLITENSNGEVSIIFKDGGVALDSLGHEIVVPKSVERKILDESNKSFNKNDFSDITYLYLNYSSRYSSLASENAKLTSNSQKIKDRYPRILEDFEVIASVDHPEEEKNKMGSCTADVKTDTKVFFAAIKKDPNGELLIDEEESSLWRHYLKDRESETRNVSATGIVHFKDFNTNVMTSNLIDPKLGKGPIFVQLGQETEEGRKITTGDDGDLWEKGFSKLHLKAIIEPHSGKFRVTVVFDDDESDRKSIRVRWWAFMADKIYKAEKIEEEAKTEIKLEKFNFVSDPEVEAKFVENGLCESGVKNCMTDGKIWGGDHYARIKKELTLIIKDKGLIKAYVALNGNPKKPAKLIKEQEKDEKWTVMEGEDWSVGGGWYLKVENVDKEASPPTARIKISFNENEPKYFTVSKGNLVTYCDDIEGETGVPLFVTYIHDINILGTDEINSYILLRKANIVLKYTWAISNTFEID